MKIQRLCRIGVVFFLGTNSWRVFAQPPPEEVQVTGAVVEKQGGKPVTQAEVEFEPQDPLPRSALKSADTDGQGKFTVKLQEGDYLVTVTAEGFRVYTQRVTLPGNKEPLQILLEPQPMIRGRIVKPGGAPLANSQVQVRVNSTQEGVPRQQENSIVTDAEGRYKVPIPNSGRLQIRLLSPGAGYAVAKEVEAEDEDLQGIDFNLAPGGSVLGQVKVKGTGEALQGANVYASGKRVWLVAARTDKEGRFILRDLPPGRCEITVYAQTFMRQQRGTTVTLQEEQTVDVGVLELAPVVRVNGRILRPDGTPLASTTIAPQIQIRMGGNNSTREQPREIKTDGEGAFQLQVTNPGEAELSLALTGLGYGSLTFKVKEGENVEGLTVRLAPFLTVKGVVRDEKTKKPLQTVKVVATYSNSWRFAVHPPPPVTTDVNGQFELTNMAPGDYCINARLNGYLQRTSQRVRLPSPKTPQITVELGRGFSVRGQVVDKEGKPVPGAEVLAGSGGESRQGRTTDAQGRFAFDNLSSVGIVRASAPGWAAAIKAAQGDPDKPIEVNLVLRHRPGALSGRVVQAGTGRPIRGALVLARLPFTSSELFEDDFHLSQMLQSFENPWVWEQRRNMDEWPWSSLEGTPFAFTDEQGCFALFDVAEGEYTVYVVGQTIRQARRYGVAVFEGKTTENVELAPCSKADKDARRVTFSGRLIKPDGNPAANLDVHWNLRISLDAPITSTSGDTWTDAKGAYVVEYREGTGNNSWASMPPFSMGSMGNVQLLLSVEGYKSILFRMLKVAHGGKVETLESKLEIAKPCSLSGQVFLPDGKTPAVGVKAMPYTRNRPYPPGSWGLGPGTVQEVGNDTHYINTGLAATTDEQGQYRIENLEAGEYGVMVALQQEDGGPRPSFAPDDPLRKAAPAFSPTVSIKEGEEVRLQVTMVPGGSISGIVVSEEGKPLPGVQVSVNHYSSVGSFSPGHSGPIDEQGHFLFEGLAATTYALSAYSQGYSSRSPKMVEIKAGQEKTDVSLKVSNMGTVSGRVFLPDGKTPAENACVSVFSVMRGNAPTGYSGITDAEGRFTVGKLSPGSCKIAAAKLGYGRGESAEVRAKLGAEVKDLSVMLTKGGVVRGKVLAVDGKTPVREALVAVVPEAENLRGFNLDSGSTGLARITSTDSRGRFELRDVPPGTVKVFAYTSRRDGEPLIFSDSSGFGGGVVRAIQRGVRVEPNGVVENLSLQLQPVDGLIRGTIRGTDGTPVARAEISATSEILPSGRTSTTTNDQGQYDLQDLPGGSYLVYAKAKGLAGIGVKNVVVSKDRPQATVDFKLTAGGTVKGTIRDRKGKPIDGGYVSTVTFWQQSGYDLTATGDLVKEDGSFVLKNLAPGDYELLIMTFDYTITKAKVVVKEGETSKLDVVVNPEN